MLDKKDIKTPEQRIDENKETEDRFSSEKLLNMFILDRLNERKKANKSKNTFK